MFGKRDIQESLLLNGFNMPNTTEIISLLDELRGKATQGEWRQGKLLLTAQTKRWTEDARRRGDEEEQRYIFTGFSGADEGRSRQVVLGCISEMSDPRLDAEYIVALHNALPTLRKAALDGERYRKAAEELEADRNRYREEAEEYSNGVRMSHKVFDDITKKAMAGEALAKTLQLMNVVDEKEKGNLFCAGVDNANKAWRKLRDNALEAYRQAVEQKEV